MAEETGQEHGAAATGGVDPAAMALALGQSGTLDPRAAAFLEKQSRIAELQIERMKAQDDHIDEEQRLQLSHLRLRRFGDYAKAAMEVPLRSSLL